MVEDYVLPARRNSARMMPYHRLDVNVSRQFELLGTDSEFYVQIFNVYSRPQRVVCAVQYERTRDRAGGDPAIAHHPHLGL